MHGDDVASAGVEVSTQIVSKTTELIMEMIKVAIEKERNVKGFKPKSAVLSGGEVTYQKLKEGGEVTMLPSFAKEDYKAFLKKAKAMDIPVAAIQESGKENTLSLFFNVKDKEAVNSIVQDIVREKLKQPEQTERMITIEKEQVEGFQMYCVDHDIPVNFLETQGGVKCIFGADYEKQMEVAVENYKNIQSELSQIGTEVEKNVKGKFQIKLTDNEQGKQLTMNFCTKAKLERVLQERMGYSEIKAVEVANSLTGKLTDSQRQYYLSDSRQLGDLTQQDGRGIRQGNMFDEVGIYHYLTEETFDAYMMGIITNKAKFINQIMTSKDPVRVSEDVDEMVLTYSQMQAIASGSPMIKEKIQLDNDIAMLKTLEAEHKKSVFRMQELAERRLPQTIDNYADLLQKASADLKAFQEQHPDNAEFKIEIGGKTVDERTDAGKEIENAIIKCSANGETVAIGKYFGFGVTVEKNPAYTNMLCSSTPCVAVLHGKLNYTCEVSLGNDIGNVRRIENLAGNQINQKIQQLSASLDKAKNDLEEAKANMAKPFERAEELAQMQSRLEFVNAELSKAQVDDEPIIVEPSEDSRDDDLDIADKINPFPRNIPPKNDGTAEPPHKFRR